METLSIAAATGAGAAATVEVVVADEHATSISDTRTSVGASRTDWSSGLTVRIVTCRSERAVASPHAGPAVTGVYGSRAEHLLLFWLRAIRGMEYRVAIVPLLLFRVRGRRLSFFESLRFGQREALRDAAQGLPNSQSLQQ